MRCIDNGITYGLDPKGCMWCHTCLEEIFGSTSKPPNDIYAILILGVDALLKIFGRAVFEAVEAEGGCLVK